jgi:hypothetical protein
MAPPKPTPSEQGGTGNLAANQDSQPTTQSGSTTSSPAGTNGQAASTPAAKKGKGKGASAYPKEAVSFGKLFCVFMVPALLQNEPIKDYEIFFYNINDFAGKASATNIAEFPIDVHMFLQQYKELIEANGTSVMTVEHFIKFVIDAQISDMRAIPYGFRSAGDVFKPWDLKNKDLEFTESGEARLPTLSAQLNSGRGTFQFPQIEVIVEVKSRRPSAGEPNDLLDAYRNLGGLNGSTVSSTDQILLIHVFDKSLNPFREETKILKSSDSTLYGYSTTPDPWVQLITAPPVQSEIKPEKPIEGPLEQYTRLNGTDGPRGIIAREFVAKRVPTLIPGMNATGILEASVSTKNDPMLKSAQMLGMNIGRNIQASPRGAGIGNLPLRVSPSTLSVKTIGCPLVNYAQMFFVDMNTGTTIDNIYGVSGITHSFGQGKFDTQLEFVLQDAYAKFESADISAQLDLTIKQLEK